MRRPAFPLGRALVIVCGLLVSLLAATAASAQTGRSTVRGTVRDQQGNVVTGASVTLSDDGKNFTRTQTTNEEGGYTAVTKAKKDRRGMIYDDLTETGKYS